MLRNILNKSTKSLLIITKNHFLKESTSKTDPYKFASLIYPEIIKMKKKTNPK